MSIKLTIDFEDLCTATFNDSCDFVTEDEALMTAKLFSKLGPEVMVFVVSSVLKSEKYKRALDKFIRKGCMIGSHTHTHRKLTDLCYEQQLYELQRSKDEIEVYANVEVNAFRAPGFFVNGDSLRALDAAKYKENWSFRKSHIKNPDLHLNKCDRYSKPISVPEIFNVPVGGGYLRLMSLISKRAFSTLISRNCVYFHPWEFANLRNIDSASGLPFKFFLGTGPSYYDKWSKIYSE